jgi:hypothetical protein
MPHGIHTKRTAMAAEHTASRYQNDKLIVSAIKLYEGFGDVDHTIKELMSL